MSGALDLLRSPSNSCSPHHSDSEWWALNKPFVLKQKPIGVAVALGALWVAATLRPSRSRVRPSQYSRHNTGTKALPSEMELWLWPWPGSGDHRHRIFCFQAEQRVLWGTCHLLVPFCVTTLCLWHCVGRVESCQRLRCRWQMLTRPEFERLVSECQRGLAGVGVKPLEQGSPTHALTYSLGPSQCNSWPPPDF